MYVLRPKNTQCPSGTAIDNLPECKLAIKLLNLEYDAVVESSGSNPIGCYKWLQHPNVYWNIHSTGGVNTDALPICKAGE